jgi:hypothetical protein
MTVARFVGVMATVFKIRWTLTVYMLELAIRVILLGAFFARSAVRRDPVRKAGA